MRKSMGHFDFLDVLKMEILTEIHKICEQEKKNIFGISQDAKHSIINLNF